MSTRNNRSTKRNACRSRQAGGFRGTAGPAGRFPHRGAAYWKGGVQTGLRYQSQCTGIHAASLPRRAGRRM
ncbi:MAG: hypothetical protein HFH89_07125 [Lachnospiraceae bacterium]|nr:hypothetical protein [uncultured Acetatifactor sp.]MCI8287411.1 hypothetical protein [Lachnospiraceae bacterium]